MTKKSDLIKREPTEEQAKFCQDFLKEGSIAKRGMFDGNYYQQLFGLMAQVVVGDLLGCPRPKNTGEWDGGIDLIKDGKKIDVKTEIRNVPFNVLHFVHNVTPSQIGYGSSHYVFCSFNRAFGVVEICGYIEKQEFLKNAEYFKDGEIRVRTDGSTLIIRGTKGLYELKNRFLKPFKELMTK